MQQEPNIPPARAQAERAVIASVLDANDAEYPPIIAKLIEHAPESFYDMRLGEIAAVIRASRLSGSPVYAARIAQAVTFEGAILFVSALANEAVSLELAEVGAKGVWASYQNRRATTALDDAAKAFLTNPQQGASIAQVLTKSLVELFEEPQGIREILEKRKFNFAVVPVPSMPRYWIGSVPISTAGNITTVSAASKGGKSAIIGAMLGAAMSGGGDSCLSFRSENKSDGAVIHLDTEQSIEDHDEQVRRAIRRAGFTKPPAWFQSYCISGFTALNAQAALRRLLEDAKRAHGGVHSVLIDGAADLVIDVNDPKECNPFVAELHALAIEYSCSIICVIHLNPGTVKTRGHLGSQLERKSESNIRLERDGEATVCWSDKNRKAPITKETGPRFVWSNEAGMHVLTESVGTARLAEQRAGMVIEAEAVFAKAGKKCLSWGEFNAILASEAKISKSGARKRFEKMVRAQVIAKENAGLYTLTP